MRNVATSIHEKHPNPLKPENRALLLPVIPSKKDEKRPSHVAPNYEILYSVRSKKEGEYKSAATGQIMTSRGKKCSANVKCSHR